MFFLHSWHHKEQVSNDFAFVLFCPDDFVSVSWCLTKPWSIYSWMLWFKGVGSSGFRLIVCENSKVNFSTAIGRWSWQWQNIHQNILFLKFHTSDIFGYNFLETFLWKKTLSFLQTTSNRLQQHFLALRSISYYIILSHLSNPFPAFLPQKMLWFWFFSNQKRKTCV